MSWVERWRQRQYEIAQGADADLFRENWRRFQWSLGMLCSGVLLAGPASRFHLPRLLRVGMAIIAGLLFIAGVFLAKSALLERRFLRKPEPERPPSIFRE
jgi:hypothetical protein